MAQGKEKRSIWGTARLTLFVLRHLFGLGVFVWLTLAVRRLDPGPVWLLFALFTVAYIGVAVFAFTRLNRMEKRSRSRNNPL